ncbi:MAG: ferritin-like domain-containing protein [Nitrospiraceae bacterium]
MSHESAAIRLPAACERALLERFLKAEAMAMWAVQAAQAQDLPESVLAFLRHHEADEARHLRRFEALLGVSPMTRAELPTVPNQWCALAVLLFGYEALGLEFARLLADVRPDMADIVRDEETHVGFFARQLRELLQRDERAARCARSAAQGWWKKFPKTLDRYLGDPSLADYREVLRAEMIQRLRRAFVELTLLPTSDDAAR